MKLSIQDLKNSIKDNKTMMKIIKKSNPEAYPALVKAFDKANTKNLDRIAKMKATGKQTITVNNWDF